MKLRHHRNTIEQRLGIVPALTRSESAGHVLTTQRVGIGLRLGTELVDGDTVGAKVEVGLVVGVTLGAKVVVGLVDGVTLGAIESLGATEGSNEGALEQKYEGLAVLPFPPLF